MRLKPGNFFQLALFVTFLTGCAQHSRVAPIASTQTQHETVVAQNPDPPKSFAEYKFIGGTLSGRERSWNISEDSTAVPRGVLSIANARDSSKHVTLYSADFSPGNFEKKDVEGALAYLFKADVADSINPPPEFPGFKVLLPPNDSDSHCGFLHLTDTTLVYFNLRGIDKPRMKGCAMDGLSLDTTGAGMGNPQNTEKRRAFLAVLINVKGLKALEDTNYAEAQLRFQQAFALDSATPEYLANLALIDDAHGDPNTGMDLLLQHPALVESSSQLCGILGAFYEEFGRYAEARDWALKALEKDPENHEWLINLSDALWGLGERVQSKNVLLRPYAEKPDFRLAVYLAATYIGLEEYENALEVLKKAHTDSAPSAKSAEYVLRSDIGLKHYEDGLDFIREQGKSFPVNAVNLFLKSSCEFNLKLYRQALESARESLKLDPSDRDAQELQTQLAALLGDKSNQLLRSPIAPLPTALDVKQARKMLRDSGWETALKGQAIGLFSQQIVYKWTPQERWTQTRHLFFLVPDGNRLIRFSELIFNLNPTFERFYVNRLRIYDSIWTPVHEGGIADYYITKNPNTSLHPENLLVHVALRRQPGKMFVEVLLTEEAQVPSAEFPYIRFEHRAGYPVLHSEFDILHPAKNMLISPFGDVRVDSLSDRIRMSMSTPSFPAEGRFAPDAEAYASGFTASPFTTWRDVGLHYLETLKKNGIDPAQPPLMAKERASDLVSGLSFEKTVQQLFHYVRDSIRYDNYEFSLQADIPDSAPDVLSKGVADCKGQALLLEQMLRARGITAHLALVNLYHAGDVGQPHLNQFNHMIVHVPRQQNEGPYFLDATEKFSSFRQYPLGLEGHNALVLDPADPRLVSIPEIDSANEHSAQIFHELEVERNHTVHGRDSLVLKGKAAAEFREHLSSWNPEAKHQNLLSWLASSYTAFNEDSFRILNEDNPDEPLIFVLYYHGKFPYLEATQPFDYFPKLEISLLRFPDAEHRTAPVYFPHTVTVESNWTYKLPSGFGWKSLSLARELEQDGLHWQLSIQQNEPATIVLHQKWRVDPFLAEPGEYRRIKTEWDPILQRCGLRLAISRQ